MPNTIQPQVDGPLMIEGDVEVLAADGTSIKKDAKMWLCRCGLSSKKPFCDGTHNKAGFSDAATGDTGPSHNKILLNKPFKRAELAGAIRQVLDALP